MRKLAVCLGLVLSLLLGPGTTRAAEAAPPDDPLVTRLRSVDPTFAGEVTTTTPRVIYESLSGRLAEPQGGGPETTARAFLTEYGPLLGMPPGPDAVRGLHLDRMRQDDHGAVVELVPFHDGLPLEASRLKACCDPSGRLVAVFGHYIPVTRVDPPPVDATTAVRRALAHTREHMPDAHLSGLGSVEQLLSPSPDGVARQIFVVTLTVGEGEQRRRVVIGPNGEVVQNTDSLLHAAYGSVFDTGQLLAAANREGTYEGMPPPAKRNQPVKSVELFDLIPPAEPGLPQTLNGKYFYSKSRYAQAVAWPSQFRYTPYQRPVADCARQCLTYEPRFLEVMMYHLLTLGRTYALTVGVREIETRRVAFDAWYLGGDYHDNASFASRSVHPDFGDDAGFIVAARNNGLFRENPIADPTVIWHEFGHFVLDSIAPDWKTGAVGSDEVQAISIQEGFADFYAAMVSGIPKEGLIYHSKFFYDLVTYEPARLKEDIYWRNLVRRCENDYRYPDDVICEPHCDGQIISSFLWKTVGVMSTPLQGATLVMEGLRLADKPLSFRGLAQGVLRADQRLHGGSHSLAIKHVALKKGLLSEWRGGGVLADVRASYRCTSLTEAIGRNAVSLVNTLTLGAWNAGFAAFNYLRRPGPASVLDDTQPDCMPIGEWFVQTEDPCP